MKTELTATEAVKSLTYYDRHAIKKEFGVIVSDENADELDVITAVAWIVETRTNPSTKPDVMKRMTVGELDSYFASDDADPLDSSNEPTKTASLLNGASTQGKAPTFTAVSASAS